MSTGSPPSWRRSRAVVTDDLAEFLSHEEVDMQQKQKVLLPTPARLRAFDDMDQPTRHVAKQGSVLLRDTAVRGVIADYQLGALANKVRDADQNATLTRMEELATWWGLPGTLQY